MSRIPTVAVSLACQRDPGTATPIQLAAIELWDLMSALGQGAPVESGLIGVTAKRLFNLRRAFVGNDWPSVRKEALV
jgi:hypothetical protein